MIQHSFHQRLKEGARRETSSNSSSTIHSLDWYFAREIEVYKRIAESLNFLDKVSAFAAKVLVEARTAPVEYWLLHSLRKKKSLKRFQSEFMIDNKSLAVLQKRWESLLQIDSDRVIISSGSIQKYVETLGSGKLPEYAKRIAYYGEKTGGEKVEG